MTYWNCSRDDTAAIETKCTRFQYAVCLVELNELLNEITWELQMDGLKIDGLIYD